MGAAGVRHKSQSGEVRNGAVGDCPLQLRKPSRVCGPSLKGTVPFGGRHRDSVSVGPRGAPDLRRGDLGFVTAVDEVGLAVAQDHGLVHDDLGHVLEGWQVVHDVEEHVFEDRALAAGAGLAVHGLARDRPQAVLTQFQVHRLHFEQARVLLGKCIPRLRQDRDEGLFVELLEGRDHRQAADELGDEAVLDEIFRLDFLEDVVAVRGPDSVWHGVVA